MAVFQDQVIVVTGASEGIGRALCLRLAKERAKLVLAARNEERLESLRAELVDRGVEGLCVPTDVTDQGQCRQLVERTVEHFGRLDVLVNNAGATMWARLDELEDPELLERLMRLNYLSSAWCTYYALEHVKRSRGLLVAVASVSGFSGIPTRTAYCASKHAMVGFFDALRIELADAGVGVTIVAPDFVLSEAHRRATGPDGKPLGESPLQQDQVMTAEECADITVRGMAKRKRLVLMTARSRLGRVMKVFAPSLVDRIARRAIEQKR
ncbi:MAG: SDR family oxidoreductase [Deltaproteobacteria bacterium]|jgi:NAD(P)-dependent dehydrogenase (short-subunit alcohol dehydrogenase family)|nr:SDR family oxidoreductase [Deltaproteobacteria bacterium]MBW2531735.1 SDR family oxidoreductase [Deltaproteobacteria bacterium]